MTEADDTPLPESDVRAMVRLLSEVIAAPGGHEVQKRRLMSGLCELTGADRWSWALATRFTPGEQSIFTAMAAGGFTESGVAKLLASAEHPDSERITTPLAREFRSLGRQITRLPEDYDPGDFFHRCDAAALWEAADVDAPLLCYRPLGDQCASAIALYRRFGEPAFDRRAARIAHIILTEVEWLHEQGWPWEAAVKVPELPGQCRLAVNLLLEGLSRKQMAEAMSLSVHTVNDYVKRVYDFFSVHSRAELIHRFRVGDGGDTPRDVPTGTSRRKPGRTSSDASASASDD